MQQQLITVTLQEFSKVLAGELRPILEQLLQLQNKQEPSNSERLNQKEVMELLRVSKQTLSSYQKRGIITAYRIKGIRSPYYLRSDIEKLFKVQKH